MINNLPDPPHTIKIDTPFKEAYYFGYYCDYCNRHMPGVQSPQGGPVRFGVSEYGPFFCTFKCAMEWRSREQK